MIKRILTLIMIGLYIVPSVYAGPTFKGVTLVSGSYGGGGGVAADYVPYSVEIREGGITTGFSYKVGIYKRTSADSGDLVVSSNAIDGSAVLGTQYGTFTTENELVPGDRYIISILSSSNINVGVSGSSNSLFYTGATYDSFPASVTSATGSSSAMFEFVIKNEGGDTLLSFGDMTSTTGSNRSSNFLYYNKDTVSITCNTL